MQHEKSVREYEETTGIDKASRETLLALLRGEENERMKMWETAQHDPVGFIYELPEFLYQKSRTESKAQMEKFNSLTEQVKAVAEEYSKRDDILCLANEYGMASEEQGFRQGFAAAMKLCVRVMAGGAY